MKRVNTRGLDGKMDRRLASKLAFRRIPGIGTGKTGEHTLLRKTNSCRVLVRLAETG